MKKNNHPEILPVLVLNGKMVSRDTHASHHVLSNACKNVFYVKCGSYVAIGVDSVVQKMF